MAIKVIPVQTKKEAMAEAAREALLQREYGQEKVERPKTIVEKLREAGPASLKTAEVNTDTVFTGAPEETVEGPEQKTVIRQLDKYRSASPKSSQEFLKQVDNSKKRYEEQKYAQSAIETREEERVNPLSELKPQVLNLDSVDNDGFGLQVQRADNFTTLFHSKINDKATVGGGYITASPKDTEGNIQTDKNFYEKTLPMAMGLDPEAVGVDPLSLKGILFDSKGFNAGQILENNDLVVHPLFGRIMGLTTEKFVYNTQIGSEQEVQFDANDPLSALQDRPEVQVDEEGGLSRGAGNALLGREIFRSWKREQNRMEGRPSDEFSESGVGQDQFEYIGTVAKEMYHAANPMMYERNESPSGSTIIYSLTPVGAKTIKAAAESSPEVFAKPKKPAANAPRPVIKRLGQEGESRLIRKEKTTAVVNRRMRKVEEAKENANSVAHQVDPLRRKIVYQLAMEALSGIKRGNELPKVGNLFKIGMDKFISFRGELAKKRLEDPNTDYNPSYEMEKQITRFLDYLNQTALESNKSKHLDYAVQELQSRMHVTNDFNPQLQPWMRYITGGLKPSEVKPKSNNDTELMFKEMMAALFIKGASKLLPDERVKAFDAEWNAPGHGALFGALIKAGRSINESLLTPEQDTQYTNLMKQIKLDVNQNGTEFINIPPELQNMPKLNVNSSLLEKAQSEGLEGLQLIEATNELFRYAQAFDNNTSFYSNLGVEIDGKTHGPLTNLMLLGSIRAAYRGGVLRKGDAVKNLDDFTLTELYNGNETEVDMQAGDIRDGMAYMMLSEGQKYAQNFTNDETLSPYLYEILELAIKDRDNFLKKPPMTLSYGQLLKNLKGAIKDTIFTGPQAQKIRAILDKPEVAKFLVKKGGPMQSKEDVTVSFLHDILADAIDTELHPGIVQVGQLLRANNVVALLSNDIMTMKNAIGYDTYIGAKQSIVKDKANLSITLPSGRKVGAVPLYESKPAGSAIRVNSQGEETPGGWGRGRVIPAVIQGVDGAWMNSMFTGSSWKQLKKDYMLPIMDAVKTDLASARRVREHANNNWWNVIKEFSYVDGIMGDWAPKTIDKFRTQLKELGNSEVSVEMDTDFRGFGWMLDPERVNPKAPMDPERNPPYKNLQFLMYDTMEFEQRPKGTPIGKFEWEKKKRAAAMVKSIMGSRFNNPEVTTSMTGNEMLAAFDRIMQALNLNVRNQKTINQVRKAKDELIALQKKADSKILQIDIG